MPLVILLQEVPLYFRIVPLAPTAKTFEADEPQTPFSDGGNRPVMPLVIALQEVPLYLRMVPLAPTAKTFEAFDPHMLLSCTVVPLVLVLQALPL